MRYQLNMFLVTSLEIEFSEAPRSVLMLPDTDLEIECHRIARPINKRHK